MQIEQYSINDSRLCLLAREHDSQVEAGLINPELIVEFPLNEGSRIVIAKEGDRFKGILNYSVCHPEGIEHLSKEISSYVSGEIQYQDGTALSEGQLNRELANRLDRIPESTSFIHLIESFSSGTGKALVNLLRSDKESGSIFLWTLHQAEGFYQHLGFSELDLYVKKRNLENRFPLMYWDGP